jgi:hypothetical protein
MMWWGHRVDEKEVRPGPGAYVLPGALQVTDTTGSIHLDTSILVIWLGCKERQTNGSHQVSSMGLQGLSCVGNCVCKQVGPRKKRAHQNFGTSAPRFETVRHDFVMSNQKHSHRI